MSEPQPLTQEEKDYIISPEGRARCHNARDVVKILINVLKYLQYHKCFNTKGEDNCKEAKEYYLKVCLPSWVKYFDLKKGWDEERVRMGLKKE
jgi:hypothetical protein